MYANGDIDANLYLPCNQVINIKCYLFLGWWVLQLGWKDIQKIFYTYALKFLNRKNIFSVWLQNVDSDWRWMSQKCYQFFINEKLKIFLIFSPAFYPIMCLMKSPKNFEKIAILKIWQLVSFWGVKIHFGEKYAWFVIEILIHESKSCLLDIYGPKK